MRKLDLKEIKSNFVKRYKGSKDGLRSFSVCPYVNLLGEGIEKLCFISTNFSIETIVALILSDEESFCYMCDDSDIEHVAGTHELTKSFTDDEENIVFGEIARKKGKIKGAKILFDFALEEEKFKMKKEAVFTALEMINSGSIRQDNMIKLQAFFAKANTLLYKCDTLEYLNVDFSDCKLILITGDAKEEKIDEMLMESYEQLKKEYGISDICTFLQNKPKPDDLKKRYIVNEIARIKEFYNEIKSCGELNQRCCEILAESSIEFFSICEKSGKKLEKMYKTAQNTGLSETVFISIEYGGIVAVVKNENVDKFVDIYTEEHKKTAGDIPAVYICNSADSGVELSDVESE